MCGEILSLSPPTSLPPSPFILDDRPALPFKIFLHPEIHINIYFYLYPPHFNRFSQRHEKGGFITRSGPGTRTSVGRFLSVGSLLFLRFYVLYRGAKNYHHLFAIFLLATGNTHTQRECVCVSV